MKRLLQLALAVALLIPAVSAFALPDLIEVYRMDPFAAIKDGDCTLCHEASFGGQRNAFGDAFGDSLHEITPLLRAQFPDYFKYPLLRVNDNLTIHFSDPQKKVVVVESGGKKIEVDLAELTVNGKKAVAPTK